MEGPDKIVGDPTQAKVNVTGSCKSIVTASSSLSKLIVCAIFMLALPISPEVENLTPSLVQEIRMDSPNCDKSRQILANSADGIFITQEKSVSGMPRCSWSRFINFIS
ncbi:hypothetical protein NQ317_003236 [Molorchus minor]|uniref:Uncharacterized protein n=1 Tax=Molorchus minor TaxID=1323400 RepID=A0ABQ9JDV9_9CUCU|nr:hypothetical protein NQ317_003236 [Molorchus minor]